MSLRTEPVQARSAARLRALLDATAAVVDEVGVDNVATNLVAERAGSSIGTLYRYFPDRSAILRGLALRHASTLHEDFQRELSLVAPDEDGLRQVLVAVGGRLVQHFREDSGWAALGFGHALDRALGDDEQQLVSPPLRGSNTPRLQIARDVAIRFSDNEVQTKALATDLDTALVLIQALVSRAFGVESETSPAVLDRARATIAEIAGGVAEAHRERRSR